MNEKSSYEKGRSWAMSFGALVYVGVVMAASTLFITFVLTAFPKDAYFSRIVMTVGGFLVGLSMLAFPVALHMWTVDKTHRLVTTALYYVEMLIIGLNTIVAFVKLLSTYAGFVMPEWAVLYEPLSIVSIVYTLAAWGTVFLTDPMHKAKRQEFEGEQRFLEKVSAKQLEYLDTVEGEDAIEAAARLKIEQAYGTERFSNAPRHFGSGRAEGTGKGRPTLRPFRDFSKQPYTLEELEAVGYTRETVEDRRNGSKPA